MRNRTGTECSIDTAAFTRAAIAEVAKHDAAIRRAELDVAGDFERWSDEVFAFWAAPGERVAS